MVQNPTGCRKTGRIPSSSNQRITGVPSRGAAPIWDQPPAMVCSDMVASGLREFQAASRHGNGRREILIAIFTPEVDRNLSGMALRKFITPDLSGASSSLMFGSIGAIELKTAIVRGDFPVFQHVEEETRHRFLPAGRTSLRGGRLFAGRKTALSETPPVELRTPLSGTPAT
jgi:hypothetical protein